MLTSITYSTFVSNTARFGGGIYLNDTKLNVSNASFHYSIASCQGGGISLYGSYLNLSGSLILLKIRLSQ